MLATKLYIPELTGETVARPRLTERLQRGLNNKLTLISAPAGFGKTTTIIEWHRSAPGRDVPLAWLSLDGGDNDLTRFLTYLVHALRRIDPDIGGRALSMVRTARRPDTTLMLTELINDTGRIDNRFVLALDDYHEISNPEIHHAMEFLIDNLPPHMRVMMTTRTDPALPLPRYRGRREITEIRLEDLRFRTDEAASFLNNIMKLGLTDEQVNGLEERTEGWIAGLLLAALSAEGGRSELAANFRGDHRYIFDYLAEEVLQGQEPEIRDFLLRTSVLDRMNAQLCDAVTGREGSQQVLERLTAANLFVIQLDLRRGWFRYHHLFGEFLQARLRQSDPTLWRETHLLAADWYDAEGMPFSAIFHTLDSGDTDLAIERIEAIAPDAIKFGRISTVETWLDRLGESVVRRSIRLTIAAAWVYMLDRQLDEASIWLSFLPEHPEERQDLDRRIIGEVLVARATYARLRVNQQESAELSAQALTFLNETDPWAPTALGHLGVAQRIDGDLAAAVDTLSRAVAASRKNGNYIILLNSMSQLSAAYMSLGRLQDAYDIGTEALEFEDEHGLRSLGMAAASRMALSHVMRERNDLEASEAYIQDCLDIIAMVGDPEDVRTNMIAHLVWSRVKFAQGNVLDALAIIDQLLEGIDEGRHSYDLADWEMLWVEAFQAWYWLAAGDTSKAAAWVERRSLSPEDEIIYRNEDAYLSLARLLAAQGQSGEARQLLDRIRQLAVAEDRIGRQIEVNACEAIILDQTGESDEALSLLETTLEIAETDSYIRTFSDEGLPMARLLEQLSGRVAVGEIRTARYSRTYLEEILETFTGADEEDESRTSGQRDTFVEPLTARELEVLQLLSRGLTNAQIADRLFVSLGTVKRHTHNIYGKLLVDNRTQAIVTGRELGLVGRERE